MALAAGASVDLDATHVSTPANFKKIDDNLGIVAFRDVDDVLGQARILDITSGSIVVGAEANISAADVNGLDVDRLQDLKAIVAFGDADDSNYPKARVLTVSGTTITPQTLSSAFESAAVHPSYVAFAIAAADNTSVLAAYRTTELRYCLLTVSGNSVSAGTPVTATTNTLGLPLAAVAMTPSTILVMYQKSHFQTGVVFQAIDITSGISQGTEVEYPTYGNGGAERSSLIKLSSTKALACWKEAGIGEILVTVVNVVGTVVTPAGLSDRLEITDTGGGVLAGITSTKALISHLGASPNRRFVETLTISGDTITQDGDGVSIVDESAGPFGLAILISTKAVAVDKTLSGTTLMEGALITGAAASGAGSAEFYESQGGIPGSI